VLVIGLMLLAVAKPPDLPYYDWTACPGEGCVYREWTARKTVVVYDTWKAGRRVEARLAVGDRVTAVHGVVVTLRPGVIQMDRDLPAQGLKRGDRVLTYTYLGEGVAVAWHHERVDEIDIGFARRPDGAGCQRNCAGTYVDLGKTEWWVEVGLKSGRTGWVLTDFQMFDGMNALV
jgi:hypothetical protein